MSYHIIHKSKKNRQHDAQKKKDEKTKTNDIQTLHRKLKIEQHESHRNRGWTQALRKGKQLLLH
jgi:hypothetical protein